MENILDVIFFIFSKTADKLYYSFIFGIKNHSIHLQI